MTFSSTFPDSSETEKKLVRQLIDFRTKRVLELGCGDGRTFTYYQDEPTQLIGLDPQWAELRLAQQAWRTTPLIHGDAATLPLTDSSFHLLVWSWAF